MKESKLIAITNDVTLTRELKNKYGSNVEIYKSVKEYQESQKGNNEVNNIK